MPNQTSNLKIPYALPGDKPAKFPTETSKPLADRLEKIWHTPKQEKLQTKSPWKVWNGYDVTVSRFGALCLITGIITCTSSETVYTDAFTIPSWARQESAIYDLPQFDIAGNRVLISLWTNGTFRIQPTTTGSVRVNLGLINPWITTIDYPTI